MARCPQVSHLLPEAQRAAPQPSVRGALQAGLIISDALHVCGRQPSPGLGCRGLLQINPHFPNQSGLHQAPVCFSKQNSEPSRRHTSVYFCLITHIPILNS